MPGSLRRILSRENFLLPVTVAGRLKENSRGASQGQPDHHISRGALTGQRALSSVDLLSLQRQVGNRAVRRLLRAGNASLQPTIQRKLKEDPEFGAVDEFGRGGTSMKATFVKGPTTIGNETTVAPPIFLKYPKSREGVGSLYKLGHLLNARLGGDGTDPKNITILSSSANTTHYYQVEKAVIEREKKLQAGEELTYEVEVVYPRVPSHEGPNVFEAQLAIELVARSSEAILGSSKQKKRTKHAVQQEPPHFHPRAAAGGGGYEPSEDLAELSSGVRDWTDLPPELDEFKDLAKMFQKHARDADGLKPLTMGIEMVEKADAGKRPAFSYQPQGLNEEQQKATEWAAHIRAQANGFDMIGLGLERMGSEVMAKKARAMAERYKKMAEQVEKYRTPQAGSMSQAPISQMGSSGTAPPGFPTSNPFSQPTSFPVPSSILQGPPSGPFGSMSQSPMPQMGTSGTARTGFFSSNPLPQPTAPPVHSSMLQGPLPVPFGSMSQSGSTSQQPIPHMGSFSSMSADPRAFAPSSSQPTLPFPAPILTPQHKPYNSGVPVPSHRPPTASSGSMPWPPIAVPQEAPTMKLLKAIQKLAPLHQVNIDILNKICAMYPTLELQLRAYGQAVGL